MSDKVSTSELYTDFMDNLRDLKNGINPQETADNLIHIFKRYAKLKKVYGSLGYAKMVKQMRDAQNDYFRNRESPNSQEFLKEAKKQEEMIDDITEKMIKYGKTLS
nr:hypothetical protein 1 [Balneolaceae bacterium]